MSAILVKGNPIDGFGFIGPFPDEVAAAEYTESSPGRHEVESDWWVASLEAPTTTQDDSKATPEEIAEARRIAACDHIEFDDDALASRGDDTVWVQGWIRISE